MTQIKNKAKETNLFNNWLNSNLSEKITESLKRFPILNFERLPNYQDIYRCTLSRIYMQDIKDLISILEKHSNQKMTFCIIPSEIDDDEGLRKIRLIIYPKYPRL